MFSLNISVYIGNNSEIWILCRKIKRFILIVCYDMSLRVWCCAMFLFINGPCCYGALKVNPSDIACKWFFTSIYNIHSINVGCIYVLLVILDLLSLLKPQVHCFDTVSLLLLPTGVWSIFKLWMIKVFRFASGIIEPIALYLLCSSSKN